MNYYEENYTNRHFIIGNDNSKSSVGFVRSNFENCSVEMHRPMMLTIHCSNFYKTAFRSLKRAVRLNWSRSFFRECTFTGKYYDMQFGLQGIISHECHNQGGLEDCDFSDASLHLCAFYNCNTATIKFPSWPHITVLSPVTNMVDWLAISFPAKFKPYQRTIARGTTEKKAVTIHWPTYAREENDTTDPESIRQLLIGKDYIVM